MRACLAVLCVVGWVSPALACWDEQNAEVGTVTASLSEGHDGSGWDAASARRALSLAFGLASLPFDSVALWTQGCEAEVCLTSCVRGQCRDTHLRSLDEVTTSTRSAWVVQVGAFTRRAGADSLLARLPSTLSPTPAYRFIAGTAVESGIEVHGPQHRVIAGVYATRADAERAGQTLRRLGHATWVRRFD